MTKPAQLSFPSPLRGEGQGEGLKQAITLEVKAELVGSVWQITAKPGDLVVLE